MTDEELGRALAEACGYQLDSYDPAYYSRWQLGDVALTNLATSLDVIERDVFPVLDERFGRGYWEINMTATSATVSAELSVARRPNTDGPLVVQYQSSGPYDSTPARALAEACLAALTEEVE